MLSLECTPVLGCGVLFRHVEKLKKNGKCLKGALGIRIAFKRHTCILPGEVLCQFTFSKVAEYFLKTEKKKHEIAFCFFEIDNGAGSVDHEIKRFR